MWQFVVPNFFLPSNQDDDESVATLVHAFVTSRIDYCNGLLAGASKVVTDKLQRVMNSAARHYKHTEVWPRSVARPTWNPTLVGWTRACHVQAMLVCLQVSAWNGTAISVGDVLADLVVAWPSSSAFCCPWRTCRSSLQTYDSWQKGILFRWPVSMEQSPDVPEWSHT